MFLTWFVQWVCGILHCVQNAMPRGFSAFWTRNPLFLSFWTSFWARKNPYYECAFMSYTIRKKCFKHDSSNGYAGFFTTFRMTCLEVFYSERAIPFFVILNELLGEEESLLWVCFMSYTIGKKCFKHDSSNEYAGFFTNVQNDIFRWFLLFCKGHSFCFVIVHEPFLFLSFWTSFWARKNLCEDVRVWVVRLLSYFKHDSSNEHVGFLTGFQNEIFWWFLIFCTSHSSFCHSE